MKINKGIDAELVSSYQAGNTVALAELVKRWHLTFCNKAFWILKDRDVSKDIAQDSWRTIIDKMHDLKDVDRFGTWAMRIVYSKSMDHIRKESREREKQEQYKLEQPLVADEPEGSKVPLKKRLLKEVRDLPDAQQHVLTLFYVEDYSLKDISKLLNISIGTAKSRLFHAREKLKKQLKPYTYEN